MATEKQIEANRRNAQKSTGPKTEAGKRVSALNSYKHGLTGQTVLLSPEQAEVRWKFVDSIVEDLKPVGAMEESLARSVADTRFRINRCVAIEDNIFAYESWAEEGRAIQKAEDDGTECEFDSIDEALAQVRSFVMDPKRFHLLTIYEARLERKAQSQLKQLRELQAERRTREEAARTATEAARAVPEKAKAAAVRTSDSIDLTHRIGLEFSGPPNKEQIDAILAIPSGTESFAELFSDVAEPRAEASRSSQLA